MQYLTKYYERHRFRQQLLPRGADMLPQKRQFVRIFAEIGHRRLARSFTMPATTAANSQLASGKTLFYGISPIRVYDESINMFDIIFFFENPLFQPTAEPAAEVAAAHLRHRTLQACWCKARSMTRTIQVGAGHLSA